MKKFFALIVARNKEYYRDRSALIWSLLFPFVVLAGFSFGYSGKQEALVRFLFVTSNAPEPSWIQRLREVPGAEILITTSFESAEKKVKRFETDLMVYGVSAESSTGSTLYKYSTHADSLKGKLAERLLLDSVSKSESSSLKLESVPVTGKQTRYAEWLLPGMIAMNIMFGSMFGVGYIIVRYRKNGVLKRLRATPLSAFLFLTAQVVSRLFIMLVTAQIVIGGAMLLIGFRPAGSWLEMLIFIAISAAAMIALGLLIAARISTEEVADGILNLMTWPMIFLSGIWFSLDGASPWVIKISQWMPLTPVVEGLRAIMIDGAHLSDLYSQISTLLALTAVLIAIASATFKWR